METGEKNIASSKREAEKYTLSSRLSKYKLESKISKRAKCPYVPTSFIRSWKAIQKSMYYMVISPSGLFLYTKYLHKRENISYSQKYCITMTLQLDIHLICMTSHTKVLHKWSLRCNDQRCKRLQILLTFWGSHNKEELLGDTYSNLLQNLVNLLCFTMPKASSGSRCKYISYLTFWAKRWKVYSKDST